MHGDVLLPVELQPLAGRRLEPGARVRRDAAPPQVAREGVVARGRRLVARVTLEQQLVDALGRDSRQRRLLLGLVAVAVEPALPPAPAVVRRGTAPVPALRDGVPSTPYLLASSEKLGLTPHSLSAFSPAMRLLSKAPTPLRRRFGAEPSW